MRGLLRLIAAGGIAAFFFFSWIIQLLWNSIIAGHLGLLPELNYLQAAGLWFLVALLFAWTGIGLLPCVRFRTRRRYDWDDLGDRIERRIKRRLCDWTEASDDDLEERIEAKIKRGLARWIGVDDDIEWDDLGERIERKFKRRVRAWADED